MVFISLILVMALFTVGSIYMLISTRSKLERFYNWIERKSCPNGDRRSVLSSVKFDKSFKRAPWLKTFNIWLVRIISIFIILITIPFVCAAIGAFFIRLLF